MLRKTVILTLLVFFALGTCVVMADGGGCKDKNVLQCMYNWFAGCNKPGDKGMECTCKACSKQCCKTCNTDCGGNCCSECGKK